MLQVPTYFNNVDGFQLELTTCAENLAQAGCGDQYLQDGYIRCVITHDGSYDVKLSAGYWDFRIVRLRAEQKVVFECDNEFQVIPLCRDDVLRGIQLREAHVPEVGFGVWLFVGFHQPPYADNLAYSLRLYIPTLQS